MLIIMSKFSTVAQNVKGTEVVLHSSSLFLCCVYQLPVAVTHVPVFIHLTNVQSLSVITFVYNLFT